MCMYLLLVLITQLTAPHHHHHIVMLSSLQLQQEKLVLCKELDNAKNNNSERVIANYKAKVTKHEVLHKQQVTTWTLVTKVRMVYGLVSSFNMVKGLRALS